MFKNLILYRIAAHCRLDLADFEAALQGAPFAACAPTQERSGGFVPPRGAAHGALVESVGGQWIARHVSEQRLLPAAVVAEEVAARCQSIEAEQGRRPGRREQLELREAARLQLLPRAFTRQHGTWLWLDPDARLLALDVASQTRADQIVTELIAAWPSLHLSLLQTAQSPRAAMAAWLQDGSAPGAWSLERECELKSADEQRACVRYSRHSLDIEEVGAHIQQGKLPTRLALGFNGALTLVLTETMQIKKIAFSDIVLDQAEEGGFDADVAIATSTLRQAIWDLVEVLGGELAEGGVVQDAIAVAAPQASTKASNGSQNASNPAKTPQNSPEPRANEMPVWAEVAPSNSNASPKQPPSADPNDPLALAAAIVQNHSAAPARANWFPTPSTAAPDLDEFEGAALDDDDDGSPPF